MVSGRAIISRIEGEFTRLEQIFGNKIILYGIDGDSKWNNRATRFLNPLFTDEEFQIEYTITDKKKLDSEFGLISVDFKATKQNGDLILISNKNLYRMKM